MKISPIDQAILIITEELEALLNEDSQTVNSQIAIHCGDKEKLTSYAFNHLFGCHKNMRFQFDRIEIDSFHTTQNCRDRVRGYIRQGISELL